MHSPLPKLNPVCCFPLASLCCRIPSKQEYDKAALGSNSSNISASSMVKVLRAPAEALAGTAPESQNPRFTIGQALATAAALQLLSLLLRSELHILTSREGFQAKACYGGSRVRDPYNFCLLCWPPTMCKCKIDASDSKFAVDKHARKVFQGISGSILGHPVQ